MAEPVHAAAAFCLGLGAFTVAVSTQGGVQLASEQVRPVPQSFPQAPQFCELVVIRA